MNVQAASTAYLALKRSMGMRFRTEGNVLKWFSQRFGRMDLAQVEPTAVKEFLTGSTGFRHRHYRVLRGFYRFAINRGFAAITPLPTRVDPERSSFVPYIYSTEELRKLLVATNVLRRPQTHIQHETFRTLLLLLYGTGLRISEASGLTLADVDLTSSVITVRETKFYKSRLVPVGPRLGGVLEEYARKRRRLLPIPDGEQSGFFATRTGHRLFTGRMRIVFRKMRRRAGIRREGGPRRQPRIHDLRHTFAVHRLVAWYREGADVNRMLPLLSAYLGHINIAATQRYLTMTPELLREANQRFEQYALRGAP